MTDILAGGFWNPDKSFTLTRLLCRGARRLPWHAVHQAFVSSLSTEHWNKLKRPHWWTTNASRKLSSVQKTNLRTGEKKDLVTYFCRARRWWSYCCIAALNPSVNKIRLLQMVWQQNSSQSYLTLKQSVFNVPTSRLKFEPLVSTSWLVSSSFICLPGIKPAQAWLQLKEPLPTPPSSDGDDSDSYLLQPANINFSNLHFLFSLSFEALLQIYIQGWLIN